MPQENANSINHYDKVQYEVFFCFVFSLTIFPPHLSYFSLMVQHDNNVIQNSVH